MNRIEEATKQIREALWMAYCSGRANNKYIPEEVLPDLLKRCQLFPQPLDDKELRGKIEDITYCILNTTRTDTWGHYKRMHPSKTYYEIAADQILALLQSKIEEARRQEREKMRRALAVEYHKSLEEAQAEPFPSDNLNKEHKLLWRGSANAYSEAISWLDRQALTGGE